MSANIHIFIWAVLASRNLDTRLNLWTLTLADILNLLKFSCKNLCINPTHFISVFLSFRQNLLEREDFWNTSLWGFFVCFVLLCIYNYISSSIVPFLYRNLWSPLHTFSLLGNKCRSSKDRGMSTEGLLPEEVEISRRGRKTTDRKKM